jgi:hypothetical protein
MIAVNFDPIAGGYVSDLARPNRNITGLVYRAPELAAKQLELLVEAFPDNKSVAALWEPASAEQLHIDLRSRGQDSQRGEAVRSSGRATNQFRIHIELENRQGTRCVDSDVDPAPRRRGDRIGSSLLRLLTAA